MFSTLTLLKNLYFSSEQAQLVMYHNGHLGLIKSTVSNSGSPSLCLLKHSHHRSALSPTAWRICKFTGRQEILSCRKAADWFIQLDHSDFQTSGQSPRHLRIFVLP